MIQINHLSSWRGGQQVLFDLTLTIQNRETLVVIGPSGSGKSSFLRCLNRLDAMQSGKILLDDRDIQSIPVIELRRRVGMVFQKPIAFDGTVAENIGYGPNLQDTPLSRNRILELMELASLETELVAKNAEELSGGQLQRLAIARCLANEPAVLLLDEPTSALDPIATRSVEEALHKLRDQSDLILVWVSHAIEQARRVADRVLLLDEGRIVRLDTVEAMLDPETGDKQALAFSVGDEAGLQGGTP